MKTHCIKEWLIVDGGGFVECFHEMINIGHISQGDILTLHALQFLLCVGVPRNIFHISCGCVEDFMCPRLWIVIIVVVVGDARVKYLPCGQTLVAILLEVLRHGHNVWQIDPGLVVVVVAPNGVRPPACQERRPARSTERNLS